MPSIPTPNPIPTPQVQPQVQPQIQPQVQPQIQPQVQPQVQPSLTSLDAQPSPLVKPAPTVPVNEFARSHYQVNKYDATDTNLTLPNGVKFYGHLIAVKVVLPQGVQSTKAYINGAYRVVKNGDKIVCRDADAVDLLRSDLFQELTDAQIKLSMA